MLSIPEAADEVAHEIEKLGRRAITLKADVSKEDEVEKMFEGAIKPFLRHASILP